MFKEERLLKIIKYMEDNLEGKTGIKVRELSDKFNVSSSTIRRDLKELEDTGLINRTHGGAILIESIKNQYNFHNKQEENLNMKHNIAKFAASLIEDGDIIGINSSTITYLIVNYIEAKDIKIITNSIELLNQISDNNIDMDIFVVGGIFIPEARTIEGTATVEQIENMYLDKSFIGANGIDIDKGIMTAGPIEVAGKRAMIENSDKTYFLCESSKFDKKSFYKIADFDEIDMIITDKDLEDNILERYIEKIDIKTK